MAHTYANTFVHCIFSTKERANTIPDAKREQLWAYMIGIARNEGFALISVRPNIIDGGVSRMNLPHY